MRRMIVLVASLGLVAALVWWRSSTAPKPLHPMAAATVNDYLYPGAIPDERGPQLAHCHPDIPGWYLGFQTDANRAEVRRWFEDQFGPTLFRTQSGRRVYAEVSVAFQTPWSGYVNVMAYETTSRECVKREGEPWDRDPVSTYAFENFDQVALWVDGSEYGPDDGSSALDAPPPGFVPRAMSLVDASVAVNPDDRRAIWVQIGEGSWGRYATEFVRYPG